MKTPLKDAVLQSDIDFNGYRAINVSSDENTVTAESIGLVGDGVTDNTAALQTWLDDVGDLAENATLLVPDGVYMFSGGLQDTGRRNAQILYPTVSITERTYTITIKGYHPISFIPWPDETMPIPCGPIFKSTLATGGGTEPAFIGGKGPIGGPGPENNFLGVIFENIIFQTVANPLISCLNLGQFSVVEFRGDVLIVAGNGVGEDDAVQPTTTTSYGVILPKDSFGMMQQIDNLNVFNFYTGVRFGELTHVANMSVCMCYYSLELGHAYHIGLLDRFLDWHCRNGINVTGDHPIQIQQHDIERAPAARWYTRVNDVNDAGNLAVGDITWWTVTAYVGAENLYTVNGGTGLKIRRLGAVYP